MQTIWLAYLIRSVPWCTHSVRIEHETQLATVHAHVSLNITICVYLHVK